MLLCVGNHFPLMNTLPFPLVYKFGGAHRCFLQTILKFQEIFFTFSKLGDLVNLKSEKINYNDKSHKLY